LEAVGVPIGAFEVGPAFTVELAGSGFGTDVNDPAAGAAVLRVVAVGLNAEFLKKLPGRRVAVGVVAELSVVGRTVDLEFVDRDEAAVDHELRGLRPEVGVGSEGPHEYALESLSEHQGVVVGDREFINELGVDGDSATCGHYR
jgi:hypothetical protein